MEAQVKEITASQQDLTIPSSEAIAHFLAIPAEDRKAITIVDPRAETAGAGWTVAGMAVGMALGGPVGAALGGWVGNAISKSETQGARAFSVQEVAGAEFPPGHPEIGGAYLSHPIATQRYIPVTDYSSAIFAEKRRELKALLQALGARTLRISALDGRRRLS